MGLAAVLSEVPGLEMKYGTTDVIPGVKCDLLNQTSLLCGLGLVFWTPI